MEEAKSAGLLVKDLEYLRNYIIKGKYHPECYKLYNPTTKQGEANRGRSGSRIMVSIKEKVGTWKDVFALAGLGPEKIAVILHPATEAKKDGEPDYNVRIKVATLLMQIHEMTDPTINVKVEQPLPATVVIEVEKETDDA